SVPADTASSRLNAGTTAPAGRISMRSWPSAMSLTFLAKSTANSWKMSFDGQVLCMRSVMGPDWAREMAGKPSAVPAAPAAAAPARNFRREGLTSFIVSLLSTFVIAAIDQLIDQLVVCCRNTASNLSWCTMPGPRPHVAPETDRLNLAGLLHTIAQASGITPGDACRAVCMPHGAAWARQQRPCGDRA